MSRIPILLVSLVSLLWSIMLVSAPCRGEGPAFDPAAFSVRAQEMLERTAVPGMAVAVVENGKVVHLQGHGVADAAGRPVTGRTAFSIGSLTKSMTALIILQLAAEGKLDPDGPVVAYLPGFRTRDKALSDRITIDHLVTHRSGLSTLAGNRRMTRGGRNGEGPSVAVADLATEKLKSQPGARFEYSNANYAVLTHLVEVIEKEDFESVLTRRIFRPLGMADSFAGSREPAAVERATGFRSWFLLARPGAPGLGRRMLGAGGVVSSAADMARYLIALEARDPKIVPPGAERLFSGRPVHGSLGYAYGWNIYQDPEGDLIFHSGAVPGFSSLAGMLPARGRSVVVLTNFFGILGGNLAQAVTHEALGLDPVEPRPSVWAQVALWSALAAVPGFLLWIFKTARRLFFRPLPMRPWVRWLNSGAVLALVGGVVAALLMFPSLAGLSLGSARVFFPDLAQIFVSCCALALVLALGRLVLVIRGG